MSDTLLIQYDIDNPHQATWAMTNGAGEITGKITTGSLEELSEQAAAQPAVILLNSQCLHINQLQMPTQNMQKMLKAIPYAIEEYIADDIENFHFVISKNKGSNTVSVVGVNKDTLRNIIQAFQQAGITIEKIIPDALCLAADADNGQWAVLNFQQYSYLQTDILNGMAVSNEILPYVITRQLQDKNLKKPEKILFFSEQQDTSVFDEVTIDDEEIEIINITYNTHPLVVFCGHYRRALALNLLQHGFKPKRKTSGYWHHWRMAASLAGIWLVLHLALTGFQYSQLLTENRVARAEIEKIYKKSFPKSKKIINPRAQMEQKLKELKGNAGGSNNGLVFLLAEAFGDMTHDKDNITLQSLTYRNNRMDIGLDSTNLQTIETLNQNLNKNTNIKSEIVSSTAEKNKVKGNLRIEARG